MKTAIIILVLMLAGGAHAATLTLADGAFTYWPFTPISTVEGTVGAQFQVPDDVVLFSLSQNTLHIGDFTLASPLLATIPAADYTCPIGQICLVNNRGLAVLVVGSVEITPGTGGLGLSGDTAPSTAVPEPSTWLLMVAGVAVLIAASARRATEGDSR
jgi:hypothetical protein